MNLDLLKNILSFVVLLLAQALVLNHIHLFGCATPLLYVYMILLFRRDYPRWGVLVWSFVMGLCIDIFSNTPGVATASMTFIGLLQPYLLSHFVTRDSPDDLQPTMRSLGMAKFIYYTLILVFLYCILFFTIETFNFFNWLQWLESIGGSAALTVILVLVIENFRKSN
jgi:rod shape-determining protein MreD